MPKLIEGVHPTRMNLLKLKKRTKLAERGHQLLSEKLDTLMTEFFKVMEQARGIRQELAESLDAGRKDLAKARALSPFGEIEIVASSVGSRGDIELEVRNLMGVRIPEIKTPEVDIRIPYDYSFASSKLDEAVKDFDDSYRKLLKLIQNEESLRRIGEEIAKIKRRTNALEYVLIPNLKHTQNYIRFMLEELERENFFRLKIIKKKQ